MFRFHPQRLSQVRQILHGIAMRGPGAAIAFITFDAGFLLSLPLAFRMDDNRIYMDCRCVLPLPVTLTAGVALMLGKLGCRRIMIDTLATLGGLCVLSAVAVRFSSMFAR